MGEIFNFVLDIPPFLDTLYIMALLGISSSRGIMNYVCEVW